MLLEETELEPESFQDTTQKYQELEKRIEYFRAKTNYEEFLKSTKDTSPVSKELKT